MKRIFTFALVLLICTACFASCAQVEQKIGEVVSVTAVDAVAEELDKQGIDYQLADQAQLAEMQETLAQILAEEYGIEMQGELTAAVSGDYTNSETGEWVFYRTFGFASAADADAMETLANDTYADEIAQGKAKVVNGGYVIGLTVSSMVIEQE